MTRQVFAHMVARDEAGRYLQAVLEALRPHVDAFHVYDDLSSDGTDVLCMQYGAVVTRRPPFVPSFLMHEGLFRQGAWDAFSDTMRPGPGDWVLCLDADELLVAPVGLHPAIDSARGAVGVRVPIPEVFGLADDGGVLVRTDGFWGDLAAPRLFRFEGCGQFRQRALACGSVPTYLDDGAKSTDTHGVELLHLGYLDPDDRLEKHNRYAGRPGHSRAHVGSILSRPTLTPWTGGPVDIWRGVRSGG